MADLRPSTLEDELIPGPVRVGAGTALLLRGTVDARAARTGPLEVAVGNSQRTPARIAASPSAGPGRELWWSLAPIPGGTETGPATVTIAPSATSAPVGTVEIAPPDEPAPAAEPAPAELGGAPRPLIAICMATYEPDPRLLRRQIESIQAQGWDRWVCVISDDASSPERLSAIREAIAGDERFSLSPSPTRLGFYANFERALRMVPGDAGLVALSDQDDRWYPDKLELLAGCLAANPAALLAYSDMRIVDEGEHVISDTFWYQSTNAYEDIGTLAIVNTVTGGASLFRRELLDLALPFPPAFSDQHYHDHWLALCAMAVGELAYLDRPTYDYTRHTESITLTASRQWTRPLSGVGQRLLHGARVRGRRVRLATAPGALPSAYFDRYLLLRQYILVLRLRAWDRMEPRKRRPLELIDRAERSPAAASWLLGRTLRPLLGRRETLGRERVLIGGLLWSWTAGLRARRPLAALDPRN